MPPDAGAGPDIQRVIPIQREGAGLSRRNERRLFFYTSVVVAHMRGRYDALERAGRQNAVFISATVLGELWHRIHKLVSPEQGKALLALFLAQVGVLHPDEGTAEIYGAIAASLDRKGAKITR